jgi:hypothetical protein
MNDHAATVRAGRPDSKRPGPVLRKLSVVKGGRIAAAPVKRSPGHALRGGNGWSVLERDRVTGIRVELRFNRDAPQLRQLSGPQPIHVHVREPRSIFWVILERARDLCKGLRAHSSEGQRV